MRSIDRTIEVGRVEAEDFAVRSNWTDEALMLAVTARDESAFAVLYERYVDLVYSAAVRVLGDSQLAEDAAQDVFVRLWRRPETFVAERGRFVSWLMSVTRNRAVDELRARGRRRKREGVALAEPDEAHIISECQAEDDPVRAAQLHEEQTAVRRALRELPSDQKVALELAYFGGLTQQEIAVRLHEPLGTVKTRIRLGMQKLRRALEEQR
ncbi:MAG TPA: sigma-70 family RNA polymerase sigma factor [Tepidiformaceae bacterium]|nr:sigma-70 family RNA polymerase sigma factor [Tepidiformaceae bacterium]